MKKTFAAASLLALFTCSAHAELLGLEVGIANWNHEPSGGFAYDDGSGSATSADLKNDLNLKDDKENYTYAIIRHAVPLIPNIKVMTTSLSNKGSGNVTSNFTFGGTTYSATTPVTTELTLDHTDITAFWNLLDTGVTFDLGLTARQIDGKASVDDGSNFETADISGTVPMLYAALAVSPIDSLRFSVEANYIGAGESAFTDTIAKVTYYPVSMLGIEAGMRSMTIELDDLDGSFSDMEFSGSFIGVNFKF